MFNVKLKRSPGISPPAFQLPQNAIIPQTGNTSLSQSAGVVYGGTGTVPSVFLPVLHISCQIKGILPEPKIELGDCKTSAPKLKTRKVKTQSIEVKKINRMRNSLSGSPPPPLGHPQFAMVLYYLFW